MTSVTIASVNGQEARNWGQEARNWLLSPGKGGPGAHGQENKNVLNGKIATIMSHPVAEGTWQVFFSLSSRLPSRASKFPHR
jgi:hypothetical protein